MPAEDFEPAAVPEMGWNSAEDIVTDEEFANWVKRSQAQTDELLKNWDLMAGARNDGPEDEEDWDSSVEFRQEIEGALEAEAEETPAERGERLRAARGRVRRRRRRSRAITLPEELQDGGVLELGNLVVSQPYATILIGRGVIEGIIEEEITSETCSHVLVMEVRLFRPGSSAAEIRLVCRRCGTPVYYADVADITVEYQT